MRASVFSAVVAATLSIAAWTPSSAQAQILIDPTVDTGSYFPVSYTYPVYPYTYSYPAYSTWSYGWVNTAPTWNGSWYRTYPYYTGYRTNYWTGPRYGWGGGYRGGYRRW